MQLLQPNRSPVLHPGGTQRAVAAQSQSHLSALGRHRSSAAACLLARLRHSTCARGSRRTYNWRGRLAKLSATPIVKLPNTVVCLQDGVFQRSYALRVVLAPGCKRFGRSVFEECCSLSQVGAAEDTTNQLARQEQVSPHAFEKCSALRQVNFEKTEADPANCTRCIPEGCCLRAGIAQLNLPSDFNFVGPAACENCKRLHQVDLSRTELTAILGSTFAHCSHLEQLSLSKRLRRIGQEAFLLCSSLREVHTPPALLYIAHRAFSGCTQLSRLRKMKDKTTWRGPYVESNAFEKCHNFDMPAWINLLPPNQGSSRTFEAEDFYHELRKDPH